MGYQEAAGDDGGVHVDAIVVKADPAELRARRERALSSVRLTKDELWARVEAGSATPEERDAWQEVDTVTFLLGTFLLRSFLLTS